MGGFYQDQSTFFHSFLQPDESYIAKIGKTHSTFIRVESIRSTMQNQNSILIVVFGKTIKLEKGPKYQYGKERVKLCFPRTEMAS